MIHVISSIGAPLQILSAPNTPFWVSHSGATSGDMWSWFKFYCTVLYIATMLHLTAGPRGRPVASSMHHYFIKIENIAVDEIW